jgi:enoyl-CoA hydratase/carnithine racemase
MDANPSSNGRGTYAWSQPWTHLRLDRRSSSYCRVTFDHPPINTITAAMVAELGELVELIEQDRDLNVVVFDSANPDYYLEGTGPEGTSAWLELLVRLSRAPVVSIAWIRGNTTGAGLDFARACDLRFSSSTELAGEIEATALLLARFDHDAIARTKAAA